MPLAVSVALGPVGSPDEFRLELELAAEGQEGKREVSIIQRSSTLPGAIEAGNDWGEGVERVGLETSDEGEGSCAGEGVDS